VLELNAAVNESKECVVRSAANIVTGMDLCTSLSDDDVSGDNCLTVSLLNTKSLGFAVTAVLCRTNTFVVYELLYIKS